jgi:sugar phosphate isomerase/epimerase
VDPNWQDFCTLSIVHFMAFPKVMPGDGPIVETVQQIAEDPFFQGIEIGWIKDPAVRREVKAVLDANDMKVGHGAQSALLIGKHNLNSLDAAERQAAVGQLKANIDEAAELGAKRVAFLSGKDPGDELRAEALEALVASLEEACAYGQERAIALACETFDRTVDKKCLIGPSPYAAEFARRVRQKYPDFGLMYDLSHMPLLYEEPLPALATLKDVLVHIHVGNCVLDPASPAYGDLHPRFGFPGGENDVDELTAFLKALFEIGYLAEGKQDKPWVGFEVKPQSEAESSTELIEATKDVWRRAWSRL